MNPRYEERVRQIKARALIRTHAYRQRHHAKGVWFRFRRLLADAASAHEVARAVMDTLVQAGLHLEPVGLELDPPKRVGFVSASTLASLAEQREIPLRLGPELLAARELLLVPFDHPGRAPEPKVAQ